MIPQRNLSQVANRLQAKGGRRIPENVIERDYCIAWFLAGLAQCDLQPALAFKGGTALKRCYFGDYRFSEDLDFTLPASLDFDDLRGRLEDVYRLVRSESGIEFQYDRKDHRKHVNSFTFYLRYNGPLPRGSDLKIDVTPQERLVFPLCSRDVLRGYDEYVDLPVNRTVQVYSLDEIVAEKVVALADPARHEPRDLYDFWYLTSQDHVELSEAVVSAIGEKLAFRKKPCDGVEVAIAKKEDRLKALWTKRLDYQMAKLPAFEEVFRVARRTLRQSALP
jgi:predicted nucleotidyltransferase component of viral defense system